MEEIILGGNCVKYCWKWEWINMQSSLLKVSLFFLFLTFPKHISVSIHIIMKTVCYKVLYQLQRNRPKHLQYTICLYITEVLLSK